MPIEELEAISGNFDYLEGLVNTYLDGSVEDLAAFEHKVPDEVPAPEESFPARVVLGAVAEMMRPEAIDRGLTLHVVTSDAAFTGNPMVTLRILNNFVANAIRYTERGGVLVGCRRFAGRRYIAVYDTGPGLSGRELKNVQQRLIRGEQSASVEGKGLGLSIASELAQAHGLDLKVRSVPGRGSMFAVGERDTENDD